MSPTSRAMLAWALLTSAALCGCERPKVEPVPPPELVVASTIAAPLEPPPEVVAARIYAGAGPLQVAPVEVMAREGELVLERQPWRLNDREGFAWRVSAPQRAQAQVLPSDEVRPIDTLIPETLSAGPWAIINGGFYEEAPQGGFRAMGVVIARGVTHNDYTHRGGSGVFAMMDGMARIIHRPKWAALGKRRPAPQEALQSIDRIVAEGELLVTHKPDARLTARSAVALDGERVWFVVSASTSGLRPHADGFQLRQTAYTGMSLYDFAVYLKEHVGARDALNLDGAVSTQLLTQIDGQRFELTGERGAINALLLRP